MKNSVRVGYLFSSRDLAALILPLILEQTLAITVGMADTMMVSSVGEAGVSGVSLMDMVNNLIFSVLAALATGGTVVVSQYLGGGRLEDARDAAKQVLLTVFSAAMLLALLIAVALNSIKPLQRFLQTIFFLPYVTNSIAIGMVFAAMFNIIGLRPSGLEADSWGIINNVIKFFGGDPINWINAQSSYAANMAVMTVYIVWNALPFKILVLLGGLQGINKQYYEAARVDGTPRRRVFTRITVPLLSPMLAYVIITGFIGGFKEYTSIVGIFGEKMGPVGAPYRLNTMVGYIYQVLPETNYGVASAAALILFAIILVVTLINMQVSKKRVHF